MSWQHRSPGRTADLDRPVTDRARVPCRVWSATLGEARGEARGGARGGARRQDRRTTRRHMGLHSAIGTAYMAASRTTEPRHGMHCLYDHPGRAARRPPSAARRPPACGTVLSVGANQDGYALMWW